VTDRARRLPANLRGVTAIIPAGGVGSRLGTRLPKQFLSIDGMPVLAVTVQHFTRHPEVGAVIVAAPAAHLARTRRVLERLGGATRVTVIEGGMTRQESVWRAVQAAPAATEIFVVHDAVRPLITRQLMDEVLRATAAAGAAICAVAIAETVKRVRDATVVETLDRTELMAIQTPQGFRAGLLREAHEKAVRDGVYATDDAQLVERLPHPVAVVRGLEGNVKITTIEDLRRVRRGSSR
jgi:2-C-methyl-D-erythritol 4-phosphate cytidylyltransferase